MNREKQPVTQERPAPHTDDTLPEGLWSDTFTFRHGHCDPAGIVYTPHFFHVFNEIIERWFEDEHGILYHDVLGPRRTGLGYVTASGTFFTPVKMGEQVEVFIAVEAIGRRSYSLVLHAMKGGAEALRGHFTTVVTSLDTLKSIEIPDDIKAALIAYEERTQQS